MNPISTPQGNSAITQSSPLLSAKKIIALSALFLYILQTPLKILNKLIMKNNFTSTTILSTFKTHLTIIFVALALLVAIPKETIGQPSYTQSTITYSLSARPANAISTIDCDDCDYSRNIGFTFNFFGNNYTTVDVNTNGLLTFGGTSTEWVNQCLPNSTAPNNVIAAYWDDLYFAYGCTPTFFNDGTTGSSPNRVYTVYYEAYSTVAGGTCANYVYVQVKLFETSNNIEVHLQQAYNNSSATIGIENSAGTVGYQAACNQGLTNGTAWRWTPCIGSFTSCSSDVVVNSTSATCAGAAVSYSTPTATCGLVNRTSGLASGATFPLGTTTITHTISPGGATCTFNAIVTGYGIAAEGSSLPAPTSPSGCGTGQVAVGSGATRTISISPNTYYNLSWGALPANINQVQIVSNGTGGTITGNNTNWFSGTSNSMVVQASRSSCTWVATSAVLTYNRVTPATPSAISGNSVVCSGTSNTYSVTSVTSLYNWTYPGGSPAPTGSTNSVTFSPTVGGTLTVFANNDGCVSAASSTKAITVNTLSTAPTGITGTTAYCQSVGSTSLTATGGTTGTAGVDVWYSGACGGAGGFEQDWGSQPYTTSGTTVNSTANGVLNVTSTNGDPMIVMHGIGTFAPATYKNIQIRYKVTAGTAGTAEIFFTSASLPGATGGYSVAGALISDNAWHTLNIDLSTNALYNTIGNITGWRFDWAGNTGVTMDIDFIHLGAGVLLGTGSPITVSPPVGTTTYYVNRKGACNSTTCASQVVTVYPYPTFTTTPSNILCNGGTSGTILVNVTTGTSLFRFSKDGGGTYPVVNQTSPYTFTGLSAGAYDIMIRDANGCFSVPVSTINLTQPASLPTLTETHTAVLCNGGSTGTITVTAAGGTPGYTYSKNGATGPFQVSNIFTGLAQGSYSIRVKDANGCETANTNVTITQPSALSFTTSKTDVVCFGDNNGTITLNGSGGVAPYQYSNDNGSIYNAGADPYTFSSLTPASYLVGITDANSCPTTFVSVTINEPAVLGFTTSQVDVLCNGDNTGSITVSATGGTTIYRYSKNNGLSYQLSNVFNGLTAGTYDIVVKDANNCITSAQQVTITEPTGVTFTTSLVHVLCNGDNTGSITIAAGGGTPGYEYSDDDGSNFQISNVFSTLAANIYPVKVRDANGCVTAASNIQISEPSLVTYTTSYTDVNCNGAGDGTITINGNGGVPPYQFSINNGSTFQFGPDPFTFINLPAANYMAGIRDDNGCIQGFTSITIVQPTAITFTTSQVNVFCFGGSNASITVSAAGGTGTYTYSKDNGVTFQLPNIFTGLTAGTYQIKVKDAAGCITNASSVTITQPGSGLTVTASNGSPYSTTVTANLFSNPSGGTPGYTYNWSGPASFATNPAHLLQNPTRTPTTVNMTGTYKVTVTDANGCSASAQTVMNVYDGYVWIGTTSTDWNNNSNWSFQVPDYPDDCTQKAYIQAGTPFAPTVNIPGLTVGTITLVNGASLTLNNDLILCSNLVGSVTSIVSTINGSGKLIMKSTPSIVQTLTGKSKFNAILQIDNTAGVSINTAATQIANALELKTGVVNVTASNFLVFVSNSASHSAIIDNFSPGMNGSISGAVTMQRKYDAPTSPSYKTQHYMGSPIDQPLYTAFGANGTEGRVINTLCDEKKSSANSPIGNMAKFDENWPDAAVCNLQGWYIVKTGNTENARGYSVSRGGAGILSITGNANQATSYTRTSLTNSGWSNMTLQGHRDTSGWHILSNPWLANLSLSSSGGAGMDNQVAVWQTTGPYAGGYRYYQVGFEAVNIAPFQAFLVHKTAVGGLANYTISGSDRVRTPSSVYFHSMNNDQELAINVDNTNGLRDRTIVAFNTQATDNFDAVYDGNKLWGDPDRLSLYSENNNMPMARNTLSSISNNTTIPVGFDAGLPGAFTMSFEGLNSFDATSYIMLEDRKTNTWHDVRNGNYSFTGDTTDNLDRFVLHLTPPVVINHTDATCNTLGVIHAEQVGIANWNYVVTNSNGDQISSGSLNNNNPITVNAAQGVYTITLVDNHNYTVVKQIQVNGVQVVQSSFVTSANIVEQNEDVTFTSTSTNTTNNVWEFGDNTSANGFDVVHNYTSPGVYSATLTSTNSDCNGTSTQQITVTEKATTDINSITDKSGITIWSNDNTVYVDFGKQPKVEAQIEIYNVLGQQLSSERFGRSSVYRRAFTNLEAAYVIVRVKNNDDITTKKVFVSSK